MSAFAPFGELLSEFVPSLQAAEKSPCTCMSNTGARAQDLRDSGLEAEKLKHFGVR